MINYDDLISERIMSLRQGFYLNYNLERNVVLTIKAIPGLIYSLLKGSEISLSLSKSEEEIMLYVNDNKHRPYYFKGYGFSERSEISIEKIVIDLIKSRDFQLVILNEANYQIVDAVISKEDLTYLLNNWLKNDQDELIIPLSKRPLNHLKMIDYIDLDKIKKWGNELFLGKNIFNFKDYIRDGKHGYNQEFSIRNILTEFYLENTELYYSVKLKNKEELTDFLILYQKAIVLIESKFTISSKQTKFLDSINKAIQQLNRAEEILATQPESIDNKHVQSEISNCQVLLKVCVFYDDGKNLEKAFNNIQKEYDYKYLPIFFPVNLIDQYMFYLKNLNEESAKFNIINNLIRLRAQYKKIIVVEGFDINNGAITLAI